MCVCVCVWGGIRGSARIVSPGHDNDRDARVPCQLVRVRGSKCVAPGLVFQNNVFAAGFSLRPWCPAADSGGWAVGCWVVVVVVARLYAAKS